jgi:hypothetical protein
MRMVGTIEALKYSGSKTAGFGDHTNLTAMP